MNIDKLLVQVNASLAERYPQKHTPITMEHVEATYGRDLLTVNADAKTAKGTGRGYLTGILYLAPSDLSGFNVCPFASKGCKQACLFSAGRGKFYSVNRARITKTLAFIADRARFEAALDKSIAGVIRKAQRANLTPVIRLNGTSDLQIERIYSGLLAKYSDVQFYDYTKAVYRLQKPLPANYHLTFSLSETNLDQAKQALALGFNVAAVFRTVLPAEFLGVPVVNGDSTDLRFLDPKGGHVVGLKAKGLAKRDTSGFVHE